MTAYKMRQWVGPYRIGILMAITTAAEMSVM